ncbi:MAG: AhpC/TSA family protein [Bacteroidales bacterium]|jgi:thiol-disulfide isomerase/thioredoxin|nr:AhpC/TSA family protein [Bacteroidales bacterium]
MNTYKKLTILIVACLFFACNRNSYTITGTIAESLYEGKPVMLGKQVDNQFIWMDTVIITDGKYQFKGEVEEPVSAAIIINYAGRMDGIPVSLILENAKIKITTDAQRKSKVEGTEQNEILHAFLDAESELKQQKNTEGLQALVLEFVKTNINNVAGLSQAHKVSDFSLEQLKEAVSGATEETLKNPIVAKLIARIQGFESTAIGQRFADFQMRTPDGKDVALSDYAGKGTYVLVDFWASWCGPCRREIPNLIQAYKKYKDKGFEIVGVSFDADEKSWFNGLNDFNMPWPQMSDLKAFDSDAVNLYTISGIPHTVLLDKDGIIIAKDLRGEALEEKLKEIL